MSTTTHTALGSPDPDEQPHDPAPVNTDIERDNVVPLRPGTDVEPKVFDAEIATDNEPTGPASEDEPRGLVKAVRAAVVQASERTVRIAQPTVRATGFVVVPFLQGHKSWARRAVRALTLGHVRDQIRKAELAGDAVGVAEWTERLNSLKNDRKDRIKDAPGTLWAGVRALILAVIVLAGLLVVAGAWFQFDPSGWDWNAWWSLLGDIAGLIGVVVGVITQLVLYGGLPAWAVAAWREGRRRGTVPGWMATTSDSDVDVTIDETTIANALAALRIPQIRDYLKEGMPLQFITPARVDGRGTHAVIRLPAGVTAEKIARRRADLATGLHRLAKEVWPTTGTEAGILDLWVADKGALAEGAGPYPLLDGGTVDVFKGVPFGKTLRGEPLTGPIMERNTICGGMPGQGKSSAARVVMAGCALDPTAELRIWVPDANFDFEAFKPRCSRYVMGAEDEKIAEILEHLRELHDEVQTRGELLVKYEIPAVTREYANKGVGLHPIVGLLEEAHVAIQHPDYGPEIAKLLVNIVRLGRKRGIHLIVSTQAPTKDSMPRDVTRNCSNGIAYAVGDHVANDALLGQGAYAAGHRATELIPGTDRGTAVVKGFSGERSEIVQVYFLDVSRSNDQVTPIILCSLAAVAEHGVLPGADREPPQIESARDLLEDLDAVLGNDSVNAADVPALLAKHAPRWEPYRRLNGKALRAELAELGVKVPSTGNRFPVDPATVREALAKRATADLDDAD